MGFEAAVLEHTAINQAVTLWPSENPNKIVEIHLDYRSDNISN